MILGIGTDIIEVDRIRSAIEEHGDRFLERLFTQKEREYCLKHRFPFRHFAGRFAAKEAIAKSFGLGFGSDISWQDIEIINEKNGKPTVYFRGEKRNDILISISHCHAYATATAVLRELKS